MTDIKKPTLAQHAALLSLVKTRGNWTFIRLYRGFYGRRGDVNFLRRQDTGTDVDFVKGDKAPQGLSYDVVFECHVKGFLRRVKGPEGLRDHNTTFFQLTPEGVRWVVKHPKLPGYQPEHGDLVLAGIRRACKTRVSEFHSAATIEAYTDGLGKASVQRALRQLTFEDKLRVRESEWSDHEQRRGIQLFALLSKEESALLMKPGEERRKRHDEYHKLQKEAELETALRLRVALGIELDCVPEDRGGTATRGRAYLYRPKTITIRTADFEALAEKLGVELPEFPNRDEYFKED